MTYRQLLDAIDEFEDEQLDLPVMVDIDEEFFDVKRVTVQENDDRLQDGHPYFVV